MDGIKYRDLQLDNVQKVRDLGIFGLTWDVYINFLSLNLRQFCRREEGKIVSIRGDRSYQGNKTF